MPQEEIPQQRRSHTITLMYSFPSAKAVAISQIYPLFFLFLSEKKYQCDLFYIFMFECWKLQICEIKTGEILGACQEAHHINSKLQESRGGKCMHAMLTLWAAPRPPARSIGCTVSACSKRSAFWHNRITPEDAHMLLRSFFFFSYLKGLDHHFSLQPLSVLTDL